MKRNLKCMVVLFSMAVLLLTGCTNCVGTENKETKEIALSVIVGNHANAMEIPLNSPTIRGYVYDSCYTYGNVSLVKLDGSPKVYYQADIPKPEVKGLTESKKSTIASGYTEQLVNKIRDAHPETAEVDVLKAIQQAAITLQGSSENADKVLVIMDSGLSTTGYVDFTKGLLEAEVDNIVEKLKIAEAIPDLKAVRVVWMFSGQTANPQQELSERQKKKLKEIWSSILVEGGATEVHFTSDIATEIADNSYPEVSTVNVESRSIEVETIETVVLDNTSVQFVGDKATFVNKDLAMTYIEKVAEELHSHPQNKVYVIGTTATGDREFCNQLSSDRAQVVADILVNELGISDTQLVPLGLGFSDPWHIADTDDSGKYIEELASQNRKVLIVDVNGLDAEKLR